LNFRRKEAFEASFFKLKKAFIYINGGNFFESHNAKRYYKKHIYFPDAL